MESGKGPVVCGQQWTTGYGPDDPDDTGVHMCAQPPNHDREEHLRQCGSAEG